MPMPAQIKDDLIEDVKITAEEIHEGRDIEADELKYTPREYQDLVVNLLATHAAGEAFVLNDDVYAHWATDAPTAEDRFMVLRTIEEELMHAREGWRMLRQIDELIDFKDLVPYTASRLEGFNHRVDEWSEHAALCALTDRVGVFQQEEQLDNSYLPYAESIRTAFFPVEKGHAARGRYWLRQLVETPEGKEAAQRAVNIWWPRALDMFGRSDTPRQHRFIYYRLKKRTNEERRLAYIPIITAELGSLGLTAPDSLVGRVIL